VNAGAVDHARIDELRALGRAGGSNLLARLVDAFLAELPSLLDDIRAAVTARDPQRSSEAAHALKGSSAALGADRLAQLCGEIEAAGHTGDTESAAQLLPTLAEEAEQARSALAAAARREP
jgi:two-component system sensor histidine kinase/response regulator